MADDSVRRRILLYLYLFLGILTLLLMGSFAIFDSDYFLGLLDFFMVLVFICFFIFVRKVDSVYFLSLIMMLIVFLFFLLLFSTGASRQQTFVWYYTYPLFALFLLGWKVGSFLTLLLLGQSLLIAYFQDLIPFFSPYPKGLLLRFSSSYLMVSSLAVVFEITRLKTRQKLDKVLRELNELVVKDGLTGLYNRRYMDEVLSLILRQRHNGHDLLAFLMVDIDNFKLYNDTYGHLSGDKALKDVASVLSSEIRRNTDYAFRYGGEEFSLLLYGANQQTAENISQNILEDVMSLEIPHSKSPYGRLTVSIGIAMVENAYKDEAGRIIKIADLALYEAKDSGKNRFVTGFYNSSKEL